MSKPNDQIILYQSDDGKTKLEVRLEDDTVWLSQSEMADLFGKSQSTVNEHIQNIYKEGELSRAESERKSGNSENSLQKPINYYNLDVIISVGYRVRSLQGTKFRIWATKTLKEYMIKGFALDDERLKQGGNRYFDELLERIREIRASERNFYQKITDIYSTSVDYNPKSSITIDFFKVVQNKMHYAVTRLTAPEIIAKRADAKKQNMGLTSFKGGTIIHSDIHTAKNYLSYTEIKELNLLVDAYLSFAELQAMNKKVMTMADWVKRLDDYLKFSEKEILLNAGKISAKVAEEIADREFKKFKEAKMKNLNSDFDKSVEKYLKGNNTERTNGSHTKN